MESRFLDYRIPDELQASTAKASTASHRHRMSGARSANVTALICCRQAQARFHWPFQAGRLVACFTREVNSLGMAAMCPGRDRRFRLWGSADCRPSGASVRNRSSLSSSQLEILAHAFAGFHDDVHLPADPEVDPALGNRGAPTSFSCSTIVAPLRRDRIQVAAQRVQSGLPERRSGDPLPAPPSRSVGRPLTVSTPVNPSARQAPVSCGRPSRWSEPDQGMATVSP